MAGTSGPTPEVISLDAFKNVELITARIADVADHPRADRLWVLKVEDGSPEPRQIVAGIKPHYPKDRLIGRTVVLVKNLKPAVIRGETSNGMLLAVRDGEELRILTTDGDVPAGLRVS